MTRLLSSHIQHHVQSAPGMSIFQKCLADNEIHEAMYWGTWMNVSQALAQDAVKEIVEKVVEQ